MNNAILPQLPPNVDFPPEIFDSGQVEIDRVEKLFLPVHKNSNGGCHSVRFYDNTDSFRRIASYEKGVLVPFDENAPLPTWFTTYIHL